MVQSLSIVILEPKKRKPVTISTFSPSVYHKVMGPDAMILVFECCVLNQLFHSPLSPSSRKSIVPLDFLPLEWYHLPIWGFWNFSPQSQFQLLIHPAQHFSWCTLLRLVQSVCRVQLFVTPWTAARQAPLSVGFSRQEYWSGLPCLPPGDLPNPGVKPGFSHIAGRFFTMWTTREAPRILDWVASLQGIFPTQGSNLGLLHCRQILYCLSHQRNPTYVMGNNK